MLIKIMQINKCLSSIGVQAIFKETSTTPLTFWFNQDYDVSILNTLIIDNLAFDITGFQCPQFGLDDIFCRDRNYIPYNAMKLY